MEKVLSATCCNSHVVKAAAWGPRRQSYLVTYHGRAAAKIVPVEKTRGLRRSSRFNETIALGARCHGRSLDRG